MAVVNAPVERGETFSIPAIVAAVAAILSFVVPAGWAMMMAVIAMIAGGIGVFLALSPAKRGGVVSVVSIVIGAIAVIVALIRVIV